MTQTAAPRHASTTWRFSARGAVVTYSLAFLLPILLLCLLAILRGVYPFGAESFLTEDLKYQYIDFFHWYKKVLAGQESILYSFSQSLGNNAWGLWSYYLASPLNLLILAFPESLLTLAIFVITAIKLGLIGIACTFYLSRRFSLSHTHALALALCFACSLWSMTQLRNPLWMDALALLPIVALGAWRCVTSGRWCVLTASLCASIVCCWYMGYMSVLFSIVCAVLEWAIARLSDREALSGARAFSRTSGALCFTVLLSAWTLYPTIAAQLGNWTVSRTVLLVAASVVLLVLSMVLVRDLIPERAVRTVGGILVTLLVAGFVVYFGRHLLGLVQTSSPYEAILGLLSSNPRSILSSPFFGTWRINESPQLFVGYLPLLGALSLLLCKRVDRRVRLAALAFLLALLLSVVLWRVYLIWCGFRVPNGFYSRNAFLFVFGAIWATGLYLSSCTDKGARGREVLSAAVALLALATVCSLVGPDPSFTAIAVGDCLIVVYALLLSPLPPKASALALPIIAFVELLLSGWLAWPSVYTGYTQAEYEAYYSDAERELKALKAQDDSTYRIEKTYTRVGLAAWGEGLSMGFNRIGSYSSSFNANTVGFLSALGYSNPGEFSVAYRTPVLPSDTLLGVKYVFSRAPLNMLDSVDLPELAEGDLLFVNEDALSLGYASSAGVTSELPETSNPFEVQNWFASAISGRDVELYRPLDVAMVSDGGGRRTWEVTIPAGELGCSWVNSTSNVPYLYSVEDDSAVWSEDTATEGLAWDNWRFGHAIRMLGDVSDSDRTIAVSLQGTADGSEPLPEDAQCLFYALDMNAYEELVDTLSRQQLNIDACSLNKLSGTISTDGKKDGLLVTVPYDVGWTVRLDGNRVDAAPAYGVALTFVPLPSGGEHRLEMSYVPPMLLEGTCVTLAAALGLLAGKVADRQRERLSR